MGVCEGSRAPARVRRAWAILSWQPPRWMPARLVGAVRGVLLKPLRRPSLCWLEDGRPFVIRANDYIQCTRVMDEWEGGIYRALRALVPPSGVVLDIGAQVGISAIEFCEWVGEGGRVVCFEPVPAHVVQLQLNLHLNGYDGRTTVVQAAVSDAPGTAAFAYTLDQNSGMGSLRPRRAQYTSLQVTTVALDQWRKGERLASVDLVKLDIEGAEMLALNGMDEGLRRHEYRALLIELHPVELPDRVERRRGGADARAAWVSDVRLGERRVCAGGIGVAPSRLPAVTS